MDVPPKLRCLDCDYDLRGVCSEDRPKGACPECGAGFSYADQLTRSRLAAERREAVFNGWTTALMFVPGLVCGVLLCLQVIVGLFGVLAPMLPLLVLLGCPILSGWLAWRWTAYGPNQRDEDIELWQLIPLAGATILFLFIQWMSVVAGVAVVIMIVSLAGLVSR